MSDVSTLLLFGASGDLTERLLLPGLGSLLGSPRPEDKALVEGLTVVGSSRHDRDDDEWRSQVQKALLDGGADEATAGRVAGNAGWIAGDPSTPEDLSRILESVPGTPVLYFALPPAVVEKAIDALGGVELPEGVILALEKPFGSNSGAAEQLNSKLAKLVAEEQVHRVDHFLGQPTVLNLLGLRFANRIFEPVWNAENIERVEITYDEKLGLEGRAAYYDGAGALVDMLQSHLLQVLSVVAMEQPDGVDQEEFRAATAQVLAATSLWEGDPVLPGAEGSSRRARYTAGTIDGKELPSYVDEEGVDPDRGTETLAELALRVETPRWSGVPFVLRSGKAIAGPRRSIDIFFRPVTTVPRGLTGPTRANRLSIGIHPETLHLDVTMNGESDPFRLSQGELETELPERPLTEYGEVLRGILSGDPTLSVRGDVAEQCWRIVEPALAVWREGRVPLDEYEAGSAGPEGWR